MIDSEKLFEILRNNGWIFLPEGPVSPAEEEMIHDNLMRELHQLVKDSLQGKIVLDAEVVRLRLDFGRDQGWPDWYTAEHVLELILEGKEP